MLNKGFSFAFYLSWSVINNRHGSAMRHFVRDVSLVCGLSQFVTAWRLVFIHETMVVLMTWVWTFFNNNSNHPRMCVLSTLCGNVDTVHLICVYIYIFIYVHIINVTWNGPHLLHLKAFASGDSYSHTNTHTYRTFFISHDLFCQNSLIYPSSSVGLFRSLTIILSISFSYCMLPHVVPCHNRVTVHNI